MTRARHAVLLIQRLSPKYWSCTRLGVRCSALIQTQTGCATSTRAYASIASGGSRFTSGTGPQLTLEHFVQRTRALHLWRNVVRAVNKIPEPSTRHEMLHFARTEFERNKFVHDLSHIRYLISTGKTQLDSMANYIDQSVR